MGIAAIHRSVIDTALYHPSASRAVVLVSDNPAGKAVGIDITDNLYGKHGADREDGVILGCANDSAGILGNITA